MMTSINPVVVGQFDSGLFTLVCLTAAVLTYSTVALSHFPYVSRAPLTAVRGSAANFNVLCLARSYSRVSLQCPVGG
ncbi:hypothetical protein ACOSQ2_024699 [Xanthoceras sorbifolium]